MRQGFFMTAKRTSLFEPFDFDNGLALRNRVVMAPMTTWSANPDGTISDAELDYYSRRAQGVGMVITGCTHVAENGIGFTDEFAVDLVQVISRLLEANGSDTGEVVRSSSLVEEGHLTVSLEVGHFVRDNRLVDGQLLVVDTNSVSVSVGVREQTRLR